MDNQNENATNPNSREPSDLEDFFADKPVYNPEVPEEIAEGMQYYAGKFGFLAGCVLCEKFPPSKDDASRNVETATRIADRVSSFFVYSMLEKLRLLSTRGDKGAEQVAACLDRQYRKFWRDKTDEEMKKYDELLASGQIFLSSAERERRYDPFSFLQGASYSNEDVQKNPVILLCSLLLGEYYREEDHPEAGAFLMDMASSMLGDYFACFWQEDK